MKIFRQTLVAVVVCLVALLAGTSNVSAASFPVIVVDPPQIDFGPVQTGSTSSPAVTVHVGNQEGATFTLAVFGVRVEGSAAGEYSILDDGVSGRAMDGGMSATLDVIFKPLFSGPRPAELVISYNGGIYDEVIEYRLPLNGEGTGGQPPSPGTPVSSSPIGEPDTVVTSPDTSGTVASTTVTPSSTSVTSPYISGSTPAGTTPSQPGLSEGIETDGKGGNTTNGSTTWVWIAASAGALVLILLIFAFALNHGDRR